jgi:hypothetical protein
MCWAVAVISGDTMKITATLKPDQDFTGGKSTLEVKVRYYCFCIFMETTAACVHATCTLLPLRTSG